MNLLGNRKRKYRCFPSFCILPPIMCSDFVYRKELSLDGSFFNSETMNAISIPQEILSVSALIYAILYELTE